MDPLPFASPAHRLCTGGRSTLIRAPAPRAGFATGFRGDETPLLLGPRLRFVARADTADATDDREILPSNEITPREFTSVIQPRNEYAPKTHTYCD